MKKLIQIIALFIIFISGCLSIAEEPQTSIDTSTSTTSRLSTTISTIISSTTTSSTPTPTKATSTTTTTHSRPLEPPKLNLTIKSPIDVWERTFGGSSDDKAKSVQQTFDGGYIIAGYTKSFGAGEEDVYLVKTDSDGNEVWSKTIGGPERDIAEALQLTSDGGYIVAGNTKSFGEGDSDAYLIKTDSNGNVEWTQTFGGSSNEAANSVEPIHDGGYIVAGFTYSFSSSDSDPDIYLIKTDSNGNVEWNRSFGGPFTENALSVQQTFDGGYIIAGITASLGSGSNDFYLVKTDSNGDALWTRTFGGEGFDTAWSVQQTNDEGYIIIGETSSFGEMGVDAYLVKTDSSGIVVWTKNLGGSSKDVATSGKQTGDNGYVIAGYTHSFGEGKEDVYLVKIDSNGNEVWSKTIGGPDNERANSIQPISEDEFIIAGYTNSFGSGSFDMYLIKLRES
ncbi:MAG: outer membrane protein assembly factor BamB family protein [Planctomycetota bacterium]